MYPPLSKLAYTATEMDKCLAPYYAQPACTMKSTILGGGGDSLVGPLFVHSSKSACCPSKNRSFWVAEVVWAVLKTSH